MAFAPALALVLVILAGGITTLLIGAIGVLQWLRLRFGAGLVDHEGPTRLAGVARTLNQRDDIHAPLSGERAVCVEWVIEREAGKVASRVWRDVVSASERTEFTLETSDRRVQVDPTSARLALDVDDTAVIETEADLPTELQTAVEHIDPDERYRLVERRIAPGDRVTATGVLTRQNDRVRLRAPAVPRLVARLLAIPFVIADEGRDDGVGLVRDRAIAGFVLGLPPTLLSLVLLFPP
ncbi:MAG: GIDE domain-containing protein [Salinirussus sp.]